MVLPPFILLLGKLTSLHFTAKREGGGGEGSGGVGLKCVFF